MPIQAHASDGTILEFPDGTADAVIDKTMKSYVQQGKTRLSELASTVTDIPSQIGEAYLRPIHSLQDFAEWAKGPGQQPITAGNIGELGTGLKKAGSALGSAMYLGTGIGPAIEGAIKSVMGHGTGAVFGTQPVEAAGGKTPAEIGMDEAEKLQLMLGRPTRGMVPGASTARGIGPYQPPARPPPPAADPFDVTTARGPIPSGRLGESAAERRTAFETQQAGQLQSARDRIAQGFDPIGGQTLAREPVDAGEIVQQGLQRESARMRTERTAEYERAKAAGGDIHPGAFEGIGQRIKGDISFSNNPVRVDATTPLSSHSIDYLDNVISELKFKNKADPFGERNFSARRTIDGTEQLRINLEGIEQWRKNLSMWRNEAYARLRTTGQGASDARAMDHIMQAFDRRIDKMIDSPLFTGDSRARDLWKSARRLHAEERETFGRGSPESRVISEIVGSRFNDPKTPNDVIDALIGTGVNPSSKHVNIWRRTRDILGADSLEMSAAKQGLFRRLVPDTATPEQVQRNLARFLHSDGRDLANIAYTPAERAVLQELANLQPRLGVTTQPSQPTFVRTAATRLFRRIGLVAAAAMGSIAGHGLNPWALVKSIGLAAGAELGATSLQKAMQAREVARALPLVGEELTRWQRLVAVAQRRQDRAAAAKAAYGTTGLQNALRRVGISPEEIFGAKPAGAEEKQDQPKGKGDKQNRSSAQGKTHYGGPLE